MKTYCGNRRCKSDVVPTPQGKCPWCGDDLRSPIPVIAASLQRALEVTTLIHLTEPKATR